MNLHQLEVFFGCLARRLLYRHIDKTNTLKGKKMKFTGKTEMGEVKTITEGDMVLIDGVEMEITLVFPAGGFFARDNEGEEDEFDFEDIG